MIHKNASEENQTKIISIINEEKLKRRESDRLIEDASDKANFLKKSYQQLFIGIIIILASWFFYSKGIDANTIMFVPLIALIGGVFIFGLNIVKILVVLVNRKN